MGPKIDPAELLKKLADELSTSDKGPIVISATEDTHEFATGFILVTPEGMKHLDMREADFAGLNQETTSANK